MFVQFPRPRDVRLVQGQDAARVDAVRVLAVLVVEAVELPHQIEPGVHRIAEDHLAGVVHHGAEAVHQFVPRDDQRAGGPAVVPRHAVVALAVVHQIQSIRSMQMPELSGNFSTCRRAWSTRKS